MTAQHSCRVRSASCCRGMPSTLAHIASFFSVTCLHEWALPGVLTNEARSDRFRLFLHVCGIFPDGAKPIPALIVEYYLGFLLECSPLVLDLSSADGPLAEMAKNGRDLVLSDDIEKICNFVCRGTMASGDWTLPHQHMSHNTHTLSLSLARALTLSLPPSLPAHPPLARALSLFAL